MVSPKDTSSPKKQESPGPEQKSVRGTAKKTIKKEGRVLETLPNACFRVKLDDGKEILAQLAGKLRIYRIRVLPGDRVIIEITPYDSERGRIIYRLK